MKSNYDKRMSGKCADIFPASLCSFVTEETDKQKGHLVSLPAFWKDFSPLYFLFIILGANDAFSEFPVTWRDLIVLTGELCGCRAWAKKGRTFESFQSWKGRVRFINFITIQSDRRTTVKTKPLTCLAIHGTLFLDDPTDCCCYRPTLTNFPFQLLFSLFISVCFSPWQFYVSNSQSVASFLFFCFLVLGCELSFLVYSSQDPWFISCSCFWRGLPMLVNLVYGDFFFIFCFSC